jgi:hypothetical protein
MLTLIRNGWKYKDMISTIAVNEKALYTKPTLDKIWERTSLVYLFTSIGKEIEE